MMPRKRKRIGAARRVALEVLRRVEAEGAYATLALDHAFEHKAVLSGQDRALATQLVYGTLRWRRYLDYALAAHSRRPLDHVEPVLLRILRMTAYQLLLLDRVPDWAAVDEATQLAGVMRGSRAGGFVNAVSRGLAQARDRIEWPDPEEDPVRSLGVRHSFPDWIIQRLLERFERPRVESILFAMNQPALLWVRTNTLRVSVEGLVELVLASGLNPHPLSAVPGAVHLDNSQEIRSLAAHQAGLIHIQDAAAQAVCHLVDPRPGQRVLDACAAPGGKTATLAQLMKNEGEIVGCDVHPARIGLVRKQIDRLGIKIATTHTGDFTQLQQEDYGTFDRILVDAPCTALGVLRRHPEGKWRLGADDPARMAALQKEMLDAAARLLKPDGKLVYSVCTFSREEGPDLIRDWLSEHGEFAVDNPREGKRAAWHSLLDSQSQLVTWPDQHQMDGFFAVRLVRKKDGASSPR